MQQLATMLQMQALLPPLQLCRDPVTTSLLFPPRAIPVVTQVKMEDVDPVTALPAARGDEWEPRMAWALEGMCERILRDTPSNPSAELRQMLSLLYDTTFQSVEAVTRAREQQQQQPQAKHERLPGAVAT
jgi:hypothetical protein